MDLFKIFSVKELIDLRKKINGLESNKVDRAGDTITGNLTVNGENRTGTKFLIQDATNGNIRFEKSNTGLLIKQTGVISLLEYTASGVTTWGNWTFNGRIAAPLTHKEGYFIVKPYNNSTTYDDGSFLEMYYHGVKKLLNIWVRNSDGTTTAPSLLIKGNEVLHKGNTQPPAWEAYNVVEWFRAETDSTAALRTDMIWGVFPFNKTRTDNKAGFDATTNRYVIQNTGLYQFNVAVRFLDHTQGTFHAVKIVKRNSGGTIVYVQWLHEGEIYYFGNYIIGGSAIFAASAGDQIEVQYMLNSGASGSYGTSYQTTYFEGVRLN